MSLAGELSNADLPPDQVGVHCTITMDEVEGRGHLIVGSVLVVQVAGSGIDEASLQTATAAADAGCSFTTLLRDAGATVEVTTTLEGVS